MIWGYNPFELALKKYANCSATFLVFSALAEDPVLSGKVEGARVPSCGTVIIIGVLPTLYEM